MRWSHALVSLLAVLAIGACGHERTTYTVVSPPRDWVARPAILEVEPQGDIYALSDVHGGYDRMVTLLVAHHVLEARPATPADARWGAGNAIFVLTGDVFDKGPSSLDAIDLLRTIEPQASAAGGQVVFTLGNHEAEFFYDPENDKATSEDGVDTEIDAWHLTPVGVADGSDPRGQWLRDRPFGARIGGWFFAHAGNTKGRTIAALDAAIRTTVSTQDYASGEAIGADSILEARGWYATPTTAATYSAALGTKHIVFGHQPDALGPRGEIAVAFGGALFRIDCGMSPDVDDSTGKLLHIRRDGMIDIAESLAADGSARELWRGP